MVKYKWVVVKQRFLQKRWHGPLISLQQELKPALKQLMETWPVDYPHMSHSFWIVYDKNSDRKFYHSFD